jgi:hypothetical protein
MRCQLKLLIFALETIGAYTLTFAAGIAIFFVLLSISWSGEHLTGIWYLIFPLVVQDAVCDQQKNLFVGKGEI